MVAPGWKHGITSVSVMGEGGHGAPTVGGQLVDSPQQSYHPQLGRTSPVTRCFTNWRQCRRLCEQPDVF